MEVVARDQKIGGPDADRMRADCGNWKNPLAPLDFACSPLLLYLQPLISTFQLLSFSFTISSLEKKTQFVKGYYVFFIP